MIYLRPRQAFISLVLLCALPALLASAETARRLEGQRLRPPDAIKCPRNNLTSFTGKVLSYSRATGRTTLRLRTDEATTEQFTLRHPKSDDPTKWFLLRGEPFTANDWPVIEVSKSRLRQNMRATVWVCSDGTSPVVDWQPPETK
jgi:hypothetical protein